MTMNIIETNLKFKSNHKTRSGKVNGIVLHHAAASSASVETVHSWHLNNGWAGIGYHFYVRKDGKVYRGRPESWVGSHTVGHNEKIGICAEGNFDKEAMCATQKNAIIDLPGYLFNKYGKVPVYGHRELDATACPGKNYPFNSIVKGAKEPEKAETTSKKDAKIDSVLEVQYWLNNNYASGLTPDGLYGSRTKAALVKALQKELGFTGKNVDGIFGPKTKAAVKNLRLGSKGNLVKILQALLVCNGYKGAYIDGDFGSGTKDAVEQYQRKKGLDDDGVAGKDTFTALCA